MTEDEGHGQQDVSHDGCDQALEVGGLDLKKRTKSQQSSSGRFEPCVGNVSQPSD